MEDHRPAAVIMRIIRRALSLRSSPPPPPPPPPPPDAAGQPPLATGKAARRRRKRQRRRTATDAASVTPEAEESTDAASGSPAVTDAKNAGLGQEATRELLLAPKNATDAKSAASSATAEPGLGITSSGSPHPLAPKNDPELREAKNHDMIDAADAAVSSTVPKNAQRASTGPKNADSASSGTKNRDSNPKPRGIVPPFEAPPVAGQDALHGDGATLNAAATPTTGKWNKVKPKKRRAPPAPPRSLPHVPSPNAAPTGRSPAFAQERPPCPPAAAGQCPPPAAVGLLDDLNRVDSFFGNFFEPPPEDETRLKHDECRAMHQRYKVACSTLESMSKFTYCLPCFLKDEKEELTKVENTFEEVKKHMRSSHSHKAQWMKCKKSGCYAMATRADIALHSYYSH